MNEHRLRVEQLELELKENLAELSGNEKEENAQFPPLQELEKAKLEIHYTKIETKRALSPEVFDMVSHAADLQMKFHDAQVSP